MDLAVIYGAFPRPDLCGAKKRDLAAFGGFLKSESRSFHVVPTQGGPMPNLRNWPDPIRRRIGSVLASIAALSLVVGCSNNDKPNNETEPPTQ
ncbi:MAG TPA: hypothetical protein VMF89_10450, partial [Polyangiales bacterium]|nr:hypothetical protein [Polyangiales bacterium]